MAATTAARAKPKASATERVVGGSCRRAREDRADCDRRTAEDQHEGTDELGYDRVYDVGGVYLAAVEPTAPEVSWSFSSIARFAPLRIPSSIRASASGPKPSRRE